MASAEIKVAIHFGAANSKIGTQLREQRFAFDKEEISHLQQDADAISRLFIRGYLNPREHKDAYHRVHAEIVKHLNNYERSKGTKDGSTGGSQKV